MVLACIRAMLERTASHPSSPAHFIWSRTEVVGMCDITEEDRDKGRGQELSLRMIH